MNPFLTLWIEMLKAVTPKTPAERRAAWIVIEGGKKAA